MAYTLTAQRIFDRLAKRAADPRKSMTAGYGCQYRCKSDPRLKCFVGEFIRDSEYEACMECRGVRQLQSDGLLPKRLTPFVGLLNSAQAIHDTNDPILWNSQLADLAAAYDCTYTPVEKVKS